MEKIRGFEIVSKYATEQIQMPKRGTKKSACYDIFNNTGADIIIEAGAITSAITTKVKSYMLDDEVLVGHVRSGHGFKYSVRLANSCAIIDADYYNNANNEGEIFIKLHNQGDKQLVIKQGEAMAQVMFQKYLLADGDSFDMGDDRAGGFGSTSK